MHTHSNRRSSISTGALARFLSMLLVLASAGGMSLAPRVAQALPADCSVAGNTCVAPLVSDWEYHVDPQFAWPTLGLFDSEMEAISETMSFTQSHSAWCSVTPRSPNVVTRDDAYGWSTPLYIGSIDVFHANTLHFTVVGYTTQGCNLSWNYDPPMFAARDVGCLPGASLVYDTSVTPNVPFCLSSGGSWQPAKAACPTCAGGSQVVKGNPVDATNFNKQQVEVDYQGAGTSPLRMVRSYNSNIGRFGVSNSLDALGLGWTATYFQRLARHSVSVAGTTYETVYAFRPSGQVLNFNLVGGQWVGVEGDISDRLTSTGTGYEYRTADNTIETYDVGGRLLGIKQPGRPDQTLTYAGIARIPSSVSTAFGDSLTFGYMRLQDKPRLTSVTDQAGVTISYAYSAAAGSPMQSVTYQDGTSRTYGMAAPWMLQSITDESGVAYASWGYDGSGVHESQHAGGVEHYTFTSGHGWPYWSVFVDDPLGVRRQYEYVITSGVARLHSSNGNCGGCREDQSRAYDANSNVAARTDFNNNQTTYVFDLARNLETSRTEAVGTPRARTISTTWDPVWRSPTLITEPNRTTAFTYDANGNVLTRTITDTATSASRTWTWTYDSYNRVLTANGPRTDVLDVVTYTYYTCATGYQCGQVHTITDALGHVTTFGTYNAYGRPLTVTDANGVVMAVTYDARQRLTSRTVGGETTSIDYWPTGLLKKVTLPDASFVLYTYDNAHRLYKIEDGDGNRIEYTLDNMSNRTAENAYDPSSALARTHTRVFNTLNQLWKDVNAAGTAAVTTAYGYDANNNQTSSAAPLSRNTGQLYDELNRLKQITDAGSGITLFGYDANDNLAAVTDPRSKVTSYTYNGFGDLTQQASPDTGTTASTYDSGGNLATTTDARSKTGTYGYDALNRVAQLVYPDRTVSFTYDAGTNGVGRLTGASDANHSLSWTYDPQGRVTGKSQTVGAVTKSVSYGYTGGNLTSLTTPSGQAITYGYSNGRVASVTLNGSTTILHDALYEPFGAVRGWTWGNSTIAAREHDLDGKPTALSSAGDMSYAYDDAFRITGVTDLNDGTKSWTYGYDVLDRLNSATKTGQSIGYTYDANGNRLSQTGTQTATYTISSSNNRIASITGTPTRTYTYDAAGHVTGDGSRTFAFSDEGRMSSVTSGGVTTSYVLNALGQRVKKSNASFTRLFVYDEAGHLLGEYDAAGALVQETVWLDGTPVATLRPNGAGVSLYYVHTDHLDTPRRISRPSDNAVVWRWDSDPFGTSAVNEDADGDSVPFAYHLRFPGQYFDGESGLNYNYMRDYDPATGRYLESDPIGLKGGINTYTYVLGDPLGNVDPTGLLCTYSQFQGTLACTDEITGQQYLKCNAYSGRGLGLNNPNYQWLSGDVPKGLESFSHAIDAGPIPRGYYRVSAPIHRRGFGDPVLPLSPLSFNEMWGRDAFQIHGDNATGTASNGCIVANQKCRAKIKAGETLRVTW